MTGCILAERYLQFLAIGINRSFRPLRSIDYLHIGVRTVCLCELNRLIVAVDHISIVHLKHQSILSYIDNHRIVLCFLDNQLGVT